jgi:hypothetical protein
MWVQFWYYCFLHFGRLWTFDCELYWKAHTSLLVTVFCRKLALLGHIMLCLSTLLFFNFSFTSGIVCCPCGTYFPVFRSLVKISCSLLLPSWQLVNNHFSPFSHFVNVQIIYPSCQWSILTCLISFSQTLNSIICPKFVSLYIVFFA